MDEPCVRRKSTVGKGGRGVPESRNLLDFQEGYCYGNQAFPVDFVGGLCKPVARCQDCGRRGRGIRACGRNGRAFCAEYHNRRAGGQGAAQGDRRGARRAPDDLLSLIHTSLV